MTKEEALKLLERRKIYVNGKSKEIQKKLFELGYRWNNNTSLSVQLTEMPFLYSNDEHTLSWGNDMEVFINSNFINITDEEILSINITPQLKPFDKVLVRDYEEGVWEPRLYAYCNCDSEYSHRTVCGDYKYCIPYEGNENLLGTTNSPL